MKSYIIVALLAISTAVQAQEQSDSTDIFYQHLNLNEIVVTGVAGSIKLKQATAPVSIMTLNDLRTTAATNIIDAIAHQPGISQITTGSGISKPVIRGLGYNRIIVMNDGVRQEGQQWGDEHGIEIDAQEVNSVEVLKGPASLMYGSDAMAGVVIFHGAPTLPEGEIRGSVSGEYQTNNGLWGYSMNLAGNQGGVVWNARYSGKWAHAYKNKYDDYVPNSQFHEQALSGMVGLNRYWGHSHLKFGYFHLTPSIIEGERDEETGELECSTDDVKTYSHGLPFQQVYHYKVISDNAFYLPHGSLKAVVGYQQNRRQEFEESADEYGLYFQQHTLTYDVRYLNEETQGWKWAVGLNGMYQRSLNKGDEYLIPAYHLFDAGLYATATRSWDRWSINGGVRFDRRDLHSESLFDDGEERFTDFRRHFNGFAASAGAVWNINRQLNLRVNVARGFRAPNMSELASNGVHEGTVRYELGDRQLKAEHSWQADLGLDFASRYVSVQLALFANRISNYIFARRLNETMEEGYLTYQYDAGDARLLGFETGIDLHPVHCIHFENTFSYVDARQLHQSADTRYLPFTPAPRWTSELKWEVTHESRALLNNAFVSAGIECYLRQNHYYRADETETATPSYTLLNLSAGADVQWKGKKVAEVYVNADNLLDRAYQSHLSRLKYADVNPVTGRRGIYNMGRNVTLRVVVPLRLM